MSTVDRYLQMFAYRWNRKEMGEGERVNDLLRSTKGRRLSYQQLIKHIFRSMSTFFLHRNACGIIMVAGWVTPEQPATPLTGYRKRGINAPDSGSIRTN